MPAVKLTSPAARRHALGVALLLLAVPRLDAAGLAPLSAPADTMAKYHALPPVAEGLDHCRAGARNPGHADTTVIAGTRAGHGALYQALYSPARTDDEGRQATWIGTLQALWLDRQGLLREDNGDGVLGSYAEDPAVEIFRDDSTPGMHLRRFSGDPATGTAGAQVTDLAGLRPIWNARDQLNALADDAVVAQREYAASAGSGRHILTFLDLDLDGAVDDGEVLPFTTETFAGSAANLGRRGILNVQDAGDPAGSVTRLVEFVRGKDQRGWRQRQLDYAGDGTAETQRLGDIVQSTPVAVGAPAEAFDVLYDDRGYSEFRARYRNRRHVVYAGANDGMLHAFNAGFYDASAHAYRASENGAVPHPLGSELWAYVPFNLLPHLAWLANPAYTHVWYVDGKPRVFDARIFPASGDATHPHGWGTILVVGFRFGGGDLTLPRRNWCAGRYFDAFGACSATSADIVTRSAYVVLDITDPEQPPRVLAELTGTTPTTPSLTPSGSPGFGFTTSYPTVVAMSRAGNRTGAATGAAAQEKWLLVLGTGPSNLDAIAGNALRAEAGTRPDHTAKLYLYDLQRAAPGFVPGYDPYDLGRAASRAFVGDPVTVDWDLDFRADALYFGTTGGTASAPTGKLWKLDFRDAGGVGQPNASDWAPPRPMLDAGAPIGATPAVATDDFSRHWVLFGTGRFYGDPDRDTTSQNHLFGVLDRVGGTASGPDSPVDFADLVDVTGAQVAGNGTVRLPSDPSVRTRAQLVANVLGDGGWKLRLEVRRGAPSERSLSAPAVLGDMTFAAAYTPAASTCDSGTSRLIAVDFRTGTPSPVPALQAATGGAVAVEAGPARAIGIELGAGLASAPTLHLGTARSGSRLSVITHSSAAGTGRAAGRVGANARGGEIEWREQIE